jgi:hypothetical protein
MSRNIQEYLNNLVNKSRVYYLDLNNQNKKLDHNCPTCRQKVNLNCGNCSNINKQLTGEITNLSEFSNLKGINTSNNQITNLNFLNSLSNKDKLKGINLFGNQITEIDFADLWTKFPNLEKINLQNNPISAKNLNNLTNQQLTKLVKGIKDKKIRVDSLKGTILTDLLTHINELVSKGNGQQQQNARYLQTLLSSPVKNDHQPANNNPLLIGSLIILGLFVLGIGYFLGRRRKTYE